MSTGTIGTYLEIMDKAGTKLTTITIWRDGERRYVVFKREELIEI